jgi:hypothetical protein
VFEARVRSGQTGATWQRSALRRLHARGQSGDAALAKLLEQYVTGFESGRPVHAWQLDDDVAGERHV